MMGLQASPPTGKGAIILIPFTFLLAMIATTAMACRADSNGATSHAGFGHFTSSVAEVNLLADGRNATLLKEFAYVDRHNVTWSVPAGETVDGATIPRIFWSVIGGPWEGRYRFASIIHDRFCRVHEGKSWQQVHRMFYEACLAGGTDELLAKVMYAAVYHFGPKWGDTTDTGSLATLIAPERRRIAEELEARELARLKAFTGTALNTPSALTSREQTDVVLAPRSAGSKAMLGGTPISATLEKWDRIRDYIRNHPGASLEDIERIP